MPSASDRRRTLPPSGWLSLSFSDLAPLPRALLLTFATLSASAYAAWKELHYRNPLWMADVSWYRSIAEGHTAQVVQPFVSRQLGPLVARAFAALFHRGVLQGFELEAGISLLVLVGILFTLLAKSRAPLWMLAAIAVAPMLPDTMLGFLLPDLFYSALLAVLLLLLERKLWLAAALWMLPLMVARESTSLTLICLLLAAWRPLRLRGCLLAAASAAAGSAIVHHLARFSPGNQQHLPQSLYILLKVPWNTAQNLFGVELWNNINDACGTPVWQHAVHLGAIRSVGFCGFNPDLPLATLLALLTEFGLLPLLVLFVLWRRWQRPAGSPLPPEASAGHRTMLRFATLYGTACFLLGPLLGTGVSRLMGYGWPLFFVALPVWVGESSWVRSRRALWAVPLLLAAHLGLSWVYWRPTFLPAMLLLWAGSAVLLLAWSRPSGSGSGTPSAALPPAPSR